MSMITKKQHALQALSYYKIFGYPTGLGALLVHKRAVPLLMKRKRYFGGGTVAVSLAAEDFVRSLPSVVVVLVISWYLSRVGALQFHSSSCRPFVSQFLLCVGFLQ